MQSMQALKLPWDFVSDAVHAGTKTAMACVDAVHAGTKTTMGFCL